MENTCQGLSYCDIMNWKNPIVTGGFLLFMNLAFMIYLYLDMSILTVATYKVLFYTAFLIVRRNYTGEDCKTCSFFNKETVEHLYTFLYDNLNLLLDHVREIVLLQNTKNLVKVLITIFFFISVGNLFSTITLAFLLFDYFFIFNYVSKTEQYTTVRRQISEFSQNQYNLIRSKIPKYTAPQKRD